MNTLFKKEEAPPFRRDLIHCYACSLFSGGYVHPELTPGSGVLFVGEAPGATEVLKGKPFVGPAGKILRAALEGVQSTYSITNTVLCRPPLDREPTQAEIRHCKTYLDAAVANTTPALIVALGGVALRALTGKDGVIKLNGSFIKGKPPVLACVHPSYVLHTGDVVAFERGILPAVQFHLRNDFKPPVVVVVEHLPSVGECAFDIETTALRPHLGGIRCLAQSNHEQTHCTTNISANKEHLERTPLIAHQAQFEYAWLLSHGINPNIIDDTRLMAYLVDETSPTDLESLCLRYNIDTLYKPEEATELEGDALYQYNGRDARNTYLLREALRGLMSPGEVKVYREVLLPAAKNIAKVELQGVCVSEEEIERVDAELTALLADLDLPSDPFIKELEAACGKPFNVKSYPQMKVLVYDLLGYEVQRFGLTDAGKPSTKKDILERLLNFKTTPTLRKLIKHSEYMGARINFLNVMRKHLTDRGGKKFVYTNLWLGETTTGRLKSNNPNLQNPPQSFVRRIFRSRFDGGFLLDGDHDQVELRILAGLSMDERLVGSLGPGGDPHTDTARVIFNKRDITKKERDLGKRINFAIPTGATAGRVAFEAGLPMSEVKPLLAKYWREHKRLADYFDSLPREGVILSPTGMKRVVSGERAMNQARNFAIQNSALILHLMVINDLVPFLEGEGAALILPNHDGYLCDLPTMNMNIIAGVKEILERPRFDWLPVPLTASFKVGQDWWNTEKINPKGVMKDEKDDFAGHDA